MDNLREIVETKRSQFDDPFLAESAGVNDFANILGSNMYRTLVQAYREVPMQWGTYCRTTSVSDFRSADRIAGSEAEDLIDLGPGGSGPYQDSKLTEQKYSIRANTKGRSFSVTRQAIINDDLNYLTQQPLRFGRAAARTLATDIVVNTIEANDTAYDGTALFHSSHSNLDTGGGSVLTADNVTEARVAITRAEFEGQPMNLQPRYLVVPPELEHTARVIMESEMIPQPGTGVGNMNYLRNSLQVVVEPMLTSTTAWYVFADPADVPVVEVAFLNGKSEPDLLVQRPEYRMVTGGGEDEFLHGEFDEMKYAVRFDYGISVAMYQGAYKGAGV
jgi:hypothetical protein